MLLWIRTTAVVRLPKQPRLSTSYYRPSALSIKLAPAYTIRNQAQESLFCSDTEFTPILQGCQHTDIPHKFNGGLYKSI